MKNLTQKFIGLLVLVFALSFTAKSQEMDANTIDDPCTSLNDYNSILLDLNPIQTRNFVEGWNMFGFPCKESRSVSETFAEIVSDLYIIKDNEGNFYWPEFDFDGLGQLIPLEGYQTKLYNAVSDFSFCESPVDFPVVNIEGCTDCDACNFNPLATINTQTCSYPSLGFDCYGNQIEIFIGQKAYQYDGFVFYYDSLDDKGLIASNQPLEEGSSDPYLWGYQGYEYGCYNYNALPSIDNLWYYSFIGRGKQNTIDIINANCETDFGGISAAEVAANYSYGNFHDWFLPSNQELELVLEVISDQQEYQETSYWSSTEHQYDQIFTMAFVGHINSQGEVNIVGTSQKRYIHGVFPIHTFGNWAEGCISDHALNYNENADIDDGSCVYPIYGCIDEAACNYNPEANMADGSCEYTQQGYDCDGNELSQYQVGVLAEGGIVFYIDESGEHGLIAAEEDLPEMYPWGCVGSVMSGADGLVIGTGLQNTLDIVSGCSESPTAASMALEYENNGYSDWYLPSFDELMEMFNTIGNAGPNGNVGSFKDDWYISSSEFENDPSYAWINNFSETFPNPGGGFKSTPNNVRLIRSF